MEVNKNFELKKVAVRLVNDGSLLSGAEIKSPEMAVEIMGDYLRQMDREVVMVLNMTAKCNPINCSVVSIGTINQSIASPKDILKSAILSNAAKVLVMHNHPSGDLFPSRTDIAFTDRMLEVCGMIDIPLVDHIIVGPGSDDYFSFNEKNLIGKFHRNDETDYNNLNFNVKVAEVIEEPERSR